MKIDFIFNKKLVVVPILFIIISVGILGYNWFIEGFPVKRSVELTGGTLITITTKTHVDTSSVKSLFPEEDTVVHAFGGAANGVLVQTNLNPDLVLGKIGAVAEITGSSIETVGPSLGSTFWRQAQLSLLFAFVAMSLIVFILFRKIGSSIAVISAAIFDIITTSAIMNVIGIQLSLSTLAALLLLVGYSVDTDILLTSEVIKAGKGIEEGSKSAFKTGITMTSTTLAALATVLFIPTSPVINQIANVLIIGLLVDLVMTWIMNVNILRWLL